MKGKHLLVLLVVLLPHGTSLPHACGEEGDQSPGTMVTITPETTDEILANPDMGWETFHHSIRRDRNLPSWIPSTVYYIRWGWVELEPRPGEIDHELLGHVLKDCQESGQKLAFRVMCCSTTRNEPYQPGWLKQVGGKELVADYRGTDFPIADFDDPTTLERHIDFIKRLGKRYDGHPEIAHVDIGSIGWWGEWHLSGSHTNKMPSLENQIKVIDAYLVAFKKTPLLMLIGGGPALKYATEHGAGWAPIASATWAGFPKRGTTWRDAYPVEITGSHIQDVWKTAPVAWETCWDIRKWVSDGWPLRYIFNYASALHGSYINNKSSPLPTRDDVRPELERFLRRLGYRLLLKELKHPSGAKPGAKIELLMKWQNVGSAPCYKPYRLAYRLSNKDGFSKVFVSSNRVNHWLPGSIELFTDGFFKEPSDLPAGEIAAVNDSFTLPADIPAGSYMLSLAVVGEHDSSPVIRLGIKGRADDGWYPVSQIKVGNSGPIGH